MAVVAWLAHQQYHWIGRVSEVEKAASRQRIEMSLRAFGDAFDTEITRAYVAFIGVTTQSSRHERLDLGSQRFVREWASDAFRQAHGRLQVFREVSSHSVLIRSVEVEDAIPDFHQPYTVDPGPPPSFAVPTGFVVAVRAPGAPLLPLLPPKGTEFGKRSPGHVLPLHRPALPRIRVVLDEQYILHSLLPRLLDQQLGPAAALHCDMLIRSTASNSVISRWGSGNNQAWEAALKIFAIRPECLPVPLNPGQTIASRSAVLDTASVLRSVRFADRPSAPSGLWEIALRSRPTVGETVDLARRRSLAAGLVVTLALAIALAALFVSAHRARELAALHERFAASVSHELRTPLSVISSASENLADGIVENADQTLQYGKMIHAHSEQLSEMIENAIWFACAGARLAKSLT
jgi:hypothetical protein